MIKEAIATGADVNEAVANAKAALGAPLDADVKFDVIERQKKKVLGLFGGAPAKVRAYYEVPDEVKSEKKVAPAPKSAQPKKATPAPKAEKKPEPKAEAKAVSAEPAKLEKVDVESNQGLKAAVDYLTSIIKGMGVNSVNIEAFKSADNEVIIELDCGDDYGIVIGRRGETLDSIQYLTRLAANRKKAEGDFSRISLNIGNYREKRKQTLSELAKKNASKVLKYGRNFTFEPMNPYERRIIHTTVQSIEGVTSYSVGSDSDRRVVISLEDGVKPTHPSKGGYNNRGRGGRPNNNNRRRNNNNAPRRDAPQRAPKTDAGAAGVSLYGKIN
ncbi:MAG: Jag N-terminal domain-containing protein [Faecalibacterium sp.]|nr:Jag N-terminal domain-containing protein [Ruminococcus sp.]MCM1391478.1 Jag N-terminal domain-containing protein [Ruminococcus sp.]MCM1485264.1 Jag N-terminal domain-containing protein [Faecalibacterium sp.]